MARKRGTGKLGAWAFTIGVILALVAGLIPLELGLGGAIISILVLLGIVVGFLNVTDKETGKFIMAAVAIMIALYTAGSAIQANIGALGIAGTYLWSVMSNINVFVFPATIVVAIKNIYTIAKD